MYADSSMGCYVDVNWLRCVVIFFPRYFYVLFLDCTTLTGFWAANVCIHNRNTLLSAFNPPAVVWVNVNSELDPSSHRMPH